MSTLLGDARIRLRADSSGFEAEAKSGVGRALAGVAGAAKVALGTATVAGGALLTQVVKTGIAYNDLEQRSGAAFKTILGSADAATKMMGQIREFGKTSPFPRQAFIEATQQLLGFGFAADDIVPTLKVINDTTAALGGNADTIATLTDVFAKIKSQGKITGDELNRLGAVGVDAAGLLGKSLGKSGDQIRESISKGAIDADTAITILTKGMGDKFAGASANVKNTWGGAVDRVKGAFRDLSSAIVEPFISTGGGGLALDWANTLADKLRLAANAAPYIIELLKTGATDKGGLAKTLGLDSVDGIVGKVLQIRDAVTGLGDLLIKGDYTGALSRAFGWDEDSAPVDILLRLRDAAVLAGGALGALLTGDLSGAKDKLGGIGTVVGGMLPAFEGLGPAVQKAGSAFGSAFGDAITIAGGVLRIIADNMDLIVAAAPYLVGAYVAAAGSARIFAAAAAFVQARLLLGTGVTLANIAAMRAHSMALIANAAAVNGVTISEQRRMIAEAAAGRTTLRSLAVMAAQKVALVASAVATGVATAAQWAFNAALAAPLLPILAVVAGIALLVGGVILLWKHNETFRKVVTSAWQGVKDAIGSVVDWVTGTVWPALQRAWKAISDGAGAAWSAIGTGVAWLRDNVGPIFGAIGDAFSKVGSVIKTIWDGFIFPVLELFGAIVKTLFVATIGVYTALISAAWSGMAGIFSAAWSDVIQPVIGALGAAAVWLWDNALKPVIGWIVDGWNLLASGFKWAWDNVLKPVLDAYATAALWLWNKALAPVFGWIGDKWDWLKDKFSLGWTIIKGVFDALSDAVENKVKGAFERGVDAIGKAWDLLKDKAKEPIKFLLETVLQHGLIDHFNDIADVFGTKHMADVWPAKGFAAGGYTGDGGKFEPKGVVHGGEYVLTKERTRKIGVGTLERLEDHLPGFAEGGLVGLGHMLQSKDFRVSENPAFGGVHPVHVKGSDHYSGHAIDVNLAGTSGTSAREQAAIDGIIGQIQAAGFKTIWRQKGHFDHLHVSDKGGGILSKIGDLASSAVDSVTSLADPFTKILDSFKDKALSTPFGGLLADAGKSLINGAVSWISDKAGGLFGGSNGSSSGIVGEYSGETGKLSPALARAAAKSMLPPGWDFGALDSLWTKESGWSWSADNPTSSAYGIPQALPGSKMASAGKDWHDNAITQIKWGLGYIGDRYGTPQTAWEHSKRTNWYAGGTLAARRGLAVVGERGPELVDFKGGETVSTAKRTAALAGASSTPLVGSLTLVSSGDTRRDVDTVMHELRVIQRGGRTR